MLNYISGGKMEFKEVKNHKILTEFYKNCKMEINENWVQTMNPIKSIMVFQDHKILCGATVSKRNDKIILDYIGVDETLRGRGLGKKLLNEILKNEKEVYLSAKNYGFFKSQGFYEIKETFLIEECLSCPQYNKDCFPRIMKRG